MAELTHTTVRQQFDADGNGLRFQVWEDALLLAEFAQRQLARRFIECCGHPAMRIQAKRAVSATARTARRKPVRKGSDGTFDFTQAP
jgi:hypothetical protein